MIRDETKPTPINKLNSPRRLLPRSHTHTHTAFYQRLELDRNKLFANNYSFLPTHRPTDWPIHFPEPSCKLLPIISFYHLRLTSSQLSSLRKTWFEWLVDLSSNLFYICKNKNKKSIDLTSLQTTTCCCPY